MIFEIKQFKKYIKILENKGIKVKELKYIELIEEIEKLK